MEVETGYHTDGGPYEYQTNGQYYEQAEYQENEQHLEHEENQHYDETYGERNYEQNYEENEVYDEEYVEELAPAVEETAVDEEAVIRPDDVEKLLQLFLDYCCYGSARYSEEMSDMKFVKFCREMGILGATRVEPGILKLTDVDLIFVTSKPRGAKKLTFEGFCAALNSLAVKMGITFLDLMFQAVELGGPRPSVNASRAAVEAEAPSFQSDVRSAFRRQSLPAHSLDPHTPIKFQDQLRRSDAPRSAPRPSRKSENYSRTPPRQESSRTPRRVPHRYNHTTQASRNHQYEPLGELGSDAIARKSQQGSFQGRPMPWDVGSTTPQRSRMRVGADENEGFFQGGEYLKKGGPKWHNGANGLPLQENGSTLTERFRRAASIASPQNASHEAAMRRLNPAVYAGDDDGAMALRMFAAFRYFCLPTYMQRAAARSQATSIRMDNTYFVKMCRETGLLDHVFNRTDADITFSKVRKHDRKLSFSAFLVSLAIIAELRGEPVEVIQDVVLDTFLAREGADEAIDAAINTVARPFLRNQPKELQQRVRESLRATILQSRAEGMAGIVAGGGPFGQGNGGGALSGPILPSALRASLTPPFGMTPSALSHREGSFAPGSPLGSRHDSMWEGASEMSHDWPAGHYRRKLVAVGPLATPRLAYQ